MQKKSMRDIRMTIDNLDSARYHFTDMLVNKGVRIIKVIPTKPRKLGYWIHTTHALFLVTFKREYYHNFSHHFPGFEGAGWGQIGNKNMIKQASNYKAFIVMVMPDEKIYVVPGITWWAFWKNEIGREVPHAPGEIPLPLNQFYSFDDWYSFMFGSEGLYEVLET